MNVELLKGMDDCFLYFLYVAVVCDRIIKYVMVHPFRNLYHIK